MRTDMAVLALRLVARHGRACPGHPRSLAAAKEGVDARVKPGHDEWLQSCLGSRLSLVAEIRLDRAVNLDGQRIAVAVLGIPGGDAHPALADAIFLDIGLLDALEANADVARQHLLIVIGALRIGRQTVGQLVAHGLALLVHNSASISFFRPSGVAVGACRATTLPERLTRNLVKFHLIEEPSRPDFSLFR